MAKTEKKGFFIYDGLWSFTKRDLDILQESFQMTSLEYRGKRDLPKLCNGVLSNDFNLSWFVLGYATSAVILSKAFRKKSIVIAGGWDVISMPELGYGNMRDKKRLKKTRYALRNADAVIAVSKSMRRDVLRWVDRDVELVYHGFDPEEFKPCGEKENLIITVAEITEGTINLKGLKTFARAARLMPECTFAIIGGHDADSMKSLKSMSPDNLKFPGYLPHDSLLEYYRKAKVYAQLSYQESFGCALAEAMLCECVPVATEKGALPEVVGDTGFYVRYGDSDDTAEKLRRAIASDSGKRARKRIINEFPLEKRKRELIRIVEEL